jgi:hypothetical protein
MQPLCFYKTSKYFARIARVPPEALELCDKAAVPSDSV